MAEKIYGVFEFSWEAGKKRGDELAKQKAWQALRDDSIENLGFTTFKFTTDKFEAQEMCRKIREWNSPKRSTSRGVQLGLWHHGVLVHECTVEGRTGYWKLSNKDYEAATQHELYRRLKAEKDAKAH